MCFANHFAVKHPKKGVVFWSYDQEECNNFMVTSHESELITVPLDDIQEEFVQFLSQL